MLLTCPLVNCCLKTKLISHSSLPGKLKSCVGFCMKWEWISSKALKQNVHAQERPCILRKQQTGFFIDLCFVCTPNLKQALQPAATAKRIYSTYFPRLVTCLWHEGQSLILIECTCLSCSQTCQGARLRRPEVKWKQWRR